MTDQQLVPIEAQNQITNALAFCKSVADVKITDNQEYEKACGFTRQLRGLHKDLDGDRKLLKEPHKKKADEVDNAFRETLTALKNIERKLSRATSDYEIAIENERKRIAAEKAEAERKRLEDEKKAEETPAENIAGVHVITKKAPPLLQVVPEEPPPPPPQIVGKQSIPKWTAEITDKAAFLRYVVENGELLLVDVNIKMLNKMAQDALGKLNIPGVKCNKEMVSKYT